MRVSNYKYYVPSYGSIDDLLDIPGEWQGEMADDLLEELGVAAAEHWELEEGCHVEHDEWPLGFMICTEKGNECGLAIVTRYYEPCFSAEAHH